MKKTKKAIRRIVTVKCERCGHETTHSLINAETKTYRCNVCGYSRTVK